MSAIPTSSHEAHGHHDHGDHGDHGHGDHGKYPFLKHHFDTPKQQFDSAKLGMWVFLATEILFFGALFAMYAILRFKNPEVFEFASHYLDTIMGGINTCVLILSSLTMAMAVYFAQRSKKGPLVFCLFLTFLGAVGFLVIKYFEYTHKFHENLVWGASFYQPVDEEERVLVTTPHQAPATLAEQSTAPDLSPGAASAALVKLPAADASVVKKAAFGPGGLAPASGSPEQESEVKAEAAAEAKLPHLRDPKMPVNTHQFFAIYYCMTGLHGIHVVIGMGMIAWLMWGAMLGRYDGNYYTPVDLGGLYWHIVDLIWIFLFPLFYLIH